MVILVFYIIFAITLVKSNKSTPNNCFACAASNRGNNYMCQQKTKAFSLGNPWEISCCNDKNKTLTECTSSDSNICSPKYNDDNLAFYTFCPN